MSSILQRPMRTEAPPATLLIRLMVGGVFLSEGIQKFRFVQSVGSGRFATTGSLFLLVAGAGTWSLDARCSGRRSEG